MARTRSEAAKVPTVVSWGPRKVDDSMSLGLSPVTAIDHMDDLALNADVVYLPRMTNQGYNALTASARLLPTDADRAYTPRYDQRQNQAWDFYDGLEAISYGVNWMAKMAAKVRLVAAEVVPGRGEPVLIEDPQHPANLAMARLAGGVGGQATLLYDMTVHFAVPGICWVVGERPISDPTILSDPKSPYRSATYRAEAPDEETWTVYSADGLRVSNKRTRGSDGVSRHFYEVRVGGPPGSSADSAGTGGNGPGGDDRFWRPLSPDSLVVKCWTPHPRYHWLPTSPTIRGLGACVELDLVNKRIMAMILSRLASNGVLLYDKERMSLPPRTNPNDPADAANSPGDLAQIFVDVAKMAIADPASPAACIPIPIGFSVPDLTDVDPKLLMQHLTFGEGMDDKLLKLRDSAIQRVATAVDLPPEILMGMGDLNHWGANQVEDSAAKINVTSVVEQECCSLTVGYLYPMLSAADSSRIGPHGGRIIVWYDPSNIEDDKDKSENTTAAYDREEVSGKTLRREIGIDETDAPTQDEQINMLLRKMARQGSIEALQVLAGVIELKDVVPTAAPGVRPDGTYERIQAENAPRDTPPAPSPRSRPGGDTRSATPRTRGAGDTARGAGDTSPDPGRTN